MILTFLKRFLDLNKLFRWVVGDITGNIKNYIKPTMISLVQTSPTKLSSVLARSLFLQTRFQNFSLSRLQSAQLLLQSRRGLQEQGNKAVRNMLPPHVIRKSKSVKPSALSVGSSLYSIC
jgi:hypothetical protein